MMDGQNVLGAGKYMIAMLEGSFLGVTGIYRVVQIEFVKPYFPHLFKCNT